MLMLYFWFVEKYCYNLMLFHHGLNIAALFHNLFHDIDHTISFCWSLSQPE